MTLYDVVIVGAGPGGIACAIKASEKGLKYLVFEKGNTIFQGIIDSYPRGKRVYPTIPKGEPGPFPIDDLMPDPNNDPVEEYLNKIETVHKQTQHNRQPQRRIPGYQEGTG